MPALTIFSWVTPDLLTQTKSLGGVADTELKAVAVRPKRVSPTAVVMIVTELACWPIAFMNSAVATGGKSTPAMFFGICVIALDLNDCRLGVEACLKECLNLGDCRCILAVPQIQNLLQVGGAAERWVAIFA